MKCTNCGADRAEHGDCPKCGAATVTPPDAATDSAFDAILAGLDGLGHAPPPWRGAAAARSNEDDSRLVQNTARVRTAPDHSANDVAIDDKSASLFGDDEDTDDDDPDDAPDDAEIASLFGDDEDPSAATQADAPGSDDFAADNAEEDDHFHGRGRLGALAWAPGARQPLPGEAQRGFANVARLEARERARERERAAAAAEVQREDELEEFNPTHYPRTAPRKRSLWRLVPYAVALSILSIAVVSVLLQAADVMENAACSDDACEAQDRTFVGRVAFGPRTGVAQLRERLKHLDLTHHTLEAQTGDGLWGVSASRPARDRVEGELYVAGLLMRCGFEVVPDAGLDRVECITVATIRDEGELDATLEGVMVSLARRFGEPSNEAPAQDLPADTSLAVWRWRDDAAELRVLRLWLQPRDGAPGGGLAIAQQAHATTAEAP